MRVCGGGILDSGCIDALAESFRNTDRKRRGLFARQMHVTVPIRTTTIRASANKKISGTAELCAISVFALVLFFPYRAIQYDANGINEAQYIESGQLFQKNHMLYRPVSYAVYSAARTAGYHGNALDLLQVLSVIFGAIGIGLFICCASRLLTIDSRLRLGRSGSRHRLYIGTSARMRGTSCWRDYLSWVRWFSPCAVGNTGASMAAACCADVAGKYFCGSRDFDPHPALRATELRDGGRIQESEPSNSPSVPQLGRVARSAG